MFMLAGAFLGHMAMTFFLPLLMHMRDVPYACTLFYFVIQWLGVLLHTDGVMSQACYVYANRPNTWVVQQAMHAYLMIFIAQIYFPCG